MISSRASLSITDVSWNRSWISLICIEVSVKSHDTTCESHMTRCTHLSIRVTWDITSWFSCELASLRSVTWSRRISLSSSNYRYMNYTCHNYVHHTRPHSIIQVLALHTVKAQDLTVLMIYLPPQCRSICRVSKTMHYFSN